MSRANIVISNIVIKKEARKLNFGVEREKLNYSNGYLQNKED
jgi:hypothetical protein